VVRPETWSLKPAGKSEDSKTWEAEGGGTELGKSFQGEEGTDDETGEGSKESRGMSNEGLPPGTWHSSKGQGKAC
jgi:hypothetical protein